MQSAKVCTSERELSQYKATCSACPFTFAKLRTLKRLDAALVGKPLQLRVNSDE